MGLKRAQSTKLKKRNLVTFSHADSIISDQFRTIRTNIQFLPRKRKNRVFLITSPGKKEGKSTTIANLAVSIAQQGEKVLLIDANLRDPIIHHMFDIPNSVGLTNILTGRGVTDEAIYRTSIGQLDVLTSGSTLFNPAELLGNEMMTNLLNKVSTLYDIVLIDSPTILKSTETRVLANQSDGVILVLRKEKTEQEKAIKARRVLELAHAKLVGVIINEK